MRTALCALLVLAASAAASPRPEVALDERVELAATLHLAASKNEPLTGFRLDASPYARELFRIAKAAPRHPAVDAYRRMLKRPADGGAGWMSALRDLTACLDRELKLRATAECARSSLAAPAASFAAATGFLERWRAKAEPLLDAELAALAKRRDEADLVAVFEEYAGRPAPAAHRVAPSPLLEPGRAWNGLSRFEEGAEVVTVISRNGSSFDWTPVMRDVWHEQGHALLDPLLDGPDGARVLSRPGLKDAALAACYGSWPQCVREHAAQGLSAAILEKARREKRLPFYADPHLKPSLPLLPKLLARLREYEEEKRKPDLVAFYPRMLEALEGPSRGVPAEPRPGTETSPGREDFEKALAAHAQGQSDEAAAALGEALKADPDFAAAWLSLAVVESARKDAKAARAAADRAVELGRADGALAPEFLSDALSTRAAVRAAAGDAAGARADEIEALDAAPAGWPRAAELRARLGRK